MDKKCIYTQKYPNKICKKYARKHAPTYTLYAQTRRRICKCILKALAVIQDNNHSQRLKKLTFLSFRPALATMVIGWTSGSMWIYHAFSALYVFIHCIHNVLAYSAVKRRWICMLQSHGFQEMDKRLPCWKGRGKLKKKKFSHMCVPLAPKGFSSNYAPNGFLVHGALLM